MAGVFQNNPLPIPTNRNGVKNPFNKNNTKTDQLCQDCPRILVLEITREREHKYGAAPNQKRTIGKFTLYLAERNNRKNREVIMTGDTTEAQGSGGNSQSKNKGQRIALGKYKMKKHTGTTYATRYGSDTLSKHRNGNGPLPGVYVDSPDFVRSERAKKAGEKDKRSTILIHASRFPYVGSIGCINLWEKLNKTSGTDENKSISPMITLIKALDKGYWNKNELIIK